MMKKTVNLFWLFAMLAVVLSCSKESGQNDIANSETDDAEVIIPAVDGNPLTHFGVTFEDTKVSVNPNTGATAIETDDEVLVYVDEDHYATYIYNGSQFVLKEGETAVTLDAPTSVFYPADEFEPGSNVLFVKPAPVEESGDFGAISPMAGVITGSYGTYSVTLGNLASVLRVKVTADVNINSVTLDYGSMVYYATGSKYTVNASSKTMAYAFEASDYTYETVTLATPATSADVLFLIPTIGLPNGLSITANLAANHNGGANSFTMENTSTAARERSKISTLSFKAKLFNGGFGTSESPYLIASSKDFKNIHKYTTEGYAPGSLTTAHFLNAYYKQTANIDLKNAELTPIGNSSATSAQFKGHYDGNSKKLQNVNVNVDTQFAAVFGYVNGDAEIKNLTVTGSITKTETTSNSLAAGIAGILNGNAQVTGCTNQATVSSTATFTGGIVGRLYSSTAGVSNCHNTGDIGGVADVGGIVGDLNGGKVYACENRGSVTASSSEAGGIAGRMQGGTMRACYSANAALITGASRVGGLAGYQSNQGTGASLIINCATKSKVKSTGAGNYGAAGGLVGYMYSKADAGNVILTNSVALGNGVFNTRQAESYLGAIVGQVNGAAKLCYVRNCYSQNNSTTNTSAAVYYSNKADGSVITSTKQTYMGGMYGYLQNGTVQNCYCVGPDGKNGNGITSDALVGGGTKESAASTGNTRMVSNAVKNGTSTVNINSWTFAVNSIKPSTMSITNQYLVDVMNFGTWATSIMSDRMAYTSSEGTSESVCAWESLNGTAHASYDPAYPKELIDLGANYKP